uniref:Coatomer subunit epsilon n=1 Tax=Meloidogyne floridensis TaxID=298350 RepID=A0A915NL41_9BILA
MVDSLFDVRNNYYLGAYQQCINEAQVYEERLKKDYFLYRAYIALKKSSIPLSEINSNSGPELVALRRLAEYFNNDAENALRFLSRVSDQTSLECLSMKIQCLLKLWRIDLALAELKKMQEVDEDATIVQLATAWVYMAMEMVDKYGATPTLLVSQSSCLIQQQKYEDAEKLLMDAQQRDPNNPEALIGLFVIAHFLGKPIEVSNRYMNQLKQDHPTHIWTKDFIGKEQEFDRLVLT